jgi:hypothetical protein
MRGTIVKLTECSFGLTKNLGNYESVRCDLTAVFDESESVETYAEVVDSLRTQVARELDFHGDYINLCDKVRDKKSELASLVSQVDEYQSKLANAKANWDKLFELIGTEALAPLMSFFRHQDLVQNLNVVEADALMTEVENDPIPFNCSDDDDNSHEF